MSFKEWCARMIAQAKFLYVLLFVLAVVILVIVPDEINHVDWSTSKNKSYLIGVSSRPELFYKKTYSAAIHSVDEQNDFDELYGLPQVVVLDSGVHSVVASCSWSFLTKTVANSLIKQPKNFKENEIYIIRSKYINRNTILYNDCSVYIDRLLRNEWDDIPELQKEALRFYGLEI